jgi:hypothetical protein
MPNFEFTVVNFIIFEQLFPIFFQTKIENTDNTLLPKAERKFQKPDTSLEILPSSSASLVDLHIRCNQHGNEG